jgi:hypothetical protein
MGGRVRYRCIGSRTSKTTCNRPEQGEGLVTISAREILGEDNSQNKA